jgi:group I intron endonuclease
MANNIRIPKIIGIYKITSPSNKIYIGQSDHIYRRWGYYKRLASNIQQQVGIYRSLLKHGVHNHIFDIIEVCELDELNIRERYWQDHYDVLKYGLNCILVKTNEKPLINSEETKLRKSLAAPTRPIKQYSLEGLFIQRWDRIIDVERKLGIANQTITMNCQGNKDSAGGFIWRYDNSDLEVKPVKSMKYGIPVNQYDLEGNFIQEWVNIKTASIKLGIDNGSIGNVCKNKQQTAGGFKWKYKNTSEKE